jgi:hypothetical protein
MRMSWGKPGKDAVPPTGGCEVASPSKTRLRRSRRGWQGIVAPPGREDPGVVAAEGTRGENARLWWRW